MEAEKVKNTASSKQAAKKRRSSLKQAVNPPDGNISTEKTPSKTSRRVSFANCTSIKPFVHDPEKNTIWDTTYEEIVNHTDSTQSSHEQTNKTTSSTIDFLKQTHVSINLSAIVDKENIPIVSQQRGSILDRIKMTTAAAAGCELQINQNDKNLQEVEMELTQLSDIDDNGDEMKAGTLENTRLTDDMEFTCHVPGMKDIKTKMSIFDMGSTGGVPAVSSDVLTTTILADDMEFTCQVQKEKESETKWAVFEEVSVEQAIVPANPVQPEDMEFTCQIPKPLSSTVTDGNMELTYCLITEKPPVEENAEPNSTVDMEYTCQVPVIINTALSLEKTDTNMEMSAMEISCQLPQETTKDLPQPEQIVEYVMDSEMEVSYACPAKMENITRVEFCELGNGTFLEVPRPEKHIFQDQMHLSMKPLERKPTLPVKVATPSKIPVKTPEKHKIDNKTVVPGNNDESTDVEIKTFAETSFCNPPMDKTQNHIVFSQNINAFKLTTPVCSFSGLKTPTDSIHGSICDDTQHFIHQSYNDSPCSHMSNISALQAQDPIFKFWRKTLDFCAAKGVACELEDESSLGLLPDLDTTGGVLETPKKVPMSLTDYAYPLTRDMVKKFKLSLHKFNLMNSKKYDFQSKSREILALEMQIKNLLKGRQLKPILKIERLSVTDQDTDQTCCEENTEPSIVEESCELFNSIKEMETRADNLWHVGNFSSDFCTVKALNGKFEFSVRMSDMNGTVSSISTFHSISEKGNPWAMYLVRYLTNKFNDDNHLKSTIGFNYNVLSLLDYLKLVCTKFGELKRYVRGCFLVNGLEITEDSLATFTILKPELGILWDISVNVLEFAEPSISIRYGKVDISHVKELARDCPRNFDFLRNFIEKIELFITENFKGKKSKVFNFSKCI